MSAQAQKFRRGAKPLRTPEPEMKLRAREEAGITEELADAFGCEDDDDTTAYGDAVTPKVRRAGA